MPKRHILAIFQRVSSFGAWVGLQRPSSSATMVSSQDEDLAAEEAQSYLAGRPGDHCSLRTCSLLPRQPSLMVVPVAPRSSCSAFLAHQW